MSAVIVSIMCFFAVLGAIDKIRGNKLGLGEKFEQGFMAMGNMAFAILGIYTLSPVIASLVLNIVGPVFEAIRLDPSIISGILLAPDMGGYSAASMMAKNTNLANYSGIILASTIGTTISFTIPMGSGIVKKEDYVYFSKGLLIGITTIPIGAVIGGILCGLTVSEVLLNIIPIILIAMLLTIGIKKYPDKTIKAFKKFSSVIQTIGVIGLIVGIIEMNFNIKLLPGMYSLNEGIEIVCSISVILAGAYPMIHTVTKYLGQPLKVLGSKIGIGEVAVAGLISSLANNIPAFGMLDKMDERGKIVNSAFAVSGAFLFGGQLAFTTGVDKNLITAFMISKIIAATTAIIVACISTRKEKGFSGNMKVTNMEF